MCGALGGIAGAVAMDAFSTLWTIGRRNPSTQQLPDPRPEVQTAIEARQHRVDPDFAASTAMVECLARATGTKLSNRQRALAARAVPYVYGAAAGAMYGAAAGSVPVLKSAGGVLFGTLLWLAEVGAGLPLLGLLKGPGAYSLGEHLFSGASHVVFGVVAETTRRQISRRME